MQLVCHFPEHGFGANSVIGITENGANAHFMRLCGDGKLTLVCQRVGYLTRLMWHIETGCMRLSVMVSECFSDEMSSKGACVAYQNGAWHAGCELG